MLGVGVGSCLPEVLVHAVWWGCVGVYEWAVVAVVGVRCELECVRGFGVLGVGAWIGLPRSLS